MKTLSVFVFCATSLFASRQGPILPMPLHPDMVEELRATGELAKAVQAWKDFNARAALHSIPMPAEPITSGSGIAILVDFSDNKADTLHHPPAAYDSLLFSEGIWPTGSMKDFYIENSYGQFEFSGEPSPHPSSGRTWHRLAGSYDYWSENHGFDHSQEMAEEAVKAADPYVDFGAFDNDGPDRIPNSGDDDGAIDALYVVHAGPGYEENHCGKIWSHMWSTYYETNDASANGGKIRLERYSMQPEERCDGLLINMGVFAHEYGHILGLPDLYDYDYDSRGAGKWSIMAAGSWNGGGASPAHFDAWCKSQLGWVQPVRVTDYETNAELPAVEFTPVVYRLWTDADTTGRQYFLVENRRKLGLFDAKLPGEGLLVYHVDEAKRNNNDQYIPGEHSSYHHYRVAVEQADGQFGLERNLSSGDPGDPFPGTWRRREFYTHLPYPTSRDYFEEDTRVGVLDITDSDSVMYAHFDVGKNLPYFRFISTRQSGEGNARIEPGEEGTLVVTVKNLWGAVDNLEGELFVNSKAVTVTKSKVSFGSVGEEETGSNASDPFILTLSPEVPGYLETEAKLTLREQVTGFEQTFRFNLMLGWPGLLVVNDASDEGLSLIYEEVLDNLGVPHEHVTSEDLLALEDMLLASGTHDSVLVWFTGQESATLSESEEGLLQNFIASGGKLVISSQNLGEDRGSSSFYRDFLHAQFETPNQSEILINGAGNNPIVEADEQIAVAAAYGTSKDGVSATGDAVPILLYSDGNAAAIVFEDTTYQLVYLAFPFEGLTGNPYMVLSKEAFMGRVLRWFGYDLGIAEQPSRPSVWGIEILSPVVRAGDAAVMYISLAESQEVELALYDALGRRVSAKSLGFLEQGEHTVRISTTGLTSGVYFVGIKTEKGNWTSRFVLLNP